MNTDTPSPSPSGETAARLDAETPLTTGAFPSGAESSPAPGAPGIPRTDSLPAQPPLHDRDPATEPQELPIFNDSSPSPLPEPQSQAAAGTPLPQDSPSSPPGIPQLSTGLASGSEPAGAEPLDTAPGSSQATVPDPGFTPAPGLNPAATEAMEPGGPDIPSLSLTPSAGPGTEEEEPPLRPPAKNPGEQQLDPGWIQSLHYSLASRADYLQKHGHATPEQADLYRKLAPPLEEANARRTAFLLEHYANPLPAFHEMCRGNIRLMLACAPLYADVLEMRIRSMEDWTGASYLRPTGARKENLADAVAVLARDYVLGHIRKEDLELRHLAELCEHQYALMDGLMVFHMYPDAAPRDDKAVLSHFRQLQRSGVKKLERAVSNARREENRRRYEEQNPDRQARYRALREAELRRDGAFIEDEEPARELEELSGAAEVAFSSPAEGTARETEDHGVGESLHGMELSFSPDDLDRDDDARGKDSLSADGEDGAPGPGADAENAQRFIMDRITAMADGSGLSDEERGELARDYTAITLDNADRALALLRDNLTREAALRTLSFGNARTLLGASPETASRWRDEVALLEQRTGRTYLPSDLDDPGEALAEAVSDITRDYDRGLLTREQLPTGLAAEAAFQRELMDRVEAFHQAYGTGLFSDAASADRLAGLREQRREQMRELEQEALRELNDAWLDYIADPEKKPGDLPGDLAARFRWEGQDEDEDLSPSLMRAKEAMDQFREMFENKGDALIGSQDFALNLLTTLSKAEKPSGELDPDPIAREIFRQTILPLMTREQDDDTHFWRNAFLGFTQGLVHAIDAMCSDSLYGYSMEHLGGIPQPGGFYIPDARVKEAARKLRLNRSQVRPFAHELSELAALGRQPREDAHLMVKGLNIAGDALGNTSLYLIPTGFATLAFPGAMNRHYNKAVYEGKSSPLAEAFTDSFWEVASEKISYGGVKNLSRLNKVISRVPVARIAARSPWLARIERNAASRAALEMAFGLGEELVWEPFIESTGNIITRKLMSHLGLDVEQKNFAEEMEELLEQFKHPEHIVGTALFLGIMTARNAPHVMREARRFSESADKLALAGLTPEHAREVSGIADPDARLDKARQYLESDFFRDPEGALVRSAQAERALEAKKAAALTHMENYVHESLRGAGVREVTALTDGTGSYQVVFASPSTRTGTVSAPVTVRLSEAQVDALVRDALDLRLEKARQQEAAPGRERTRDAEPRPRDTAPRAWSPDAPPAHPHAPLTPVGFGLRPTTRVPGIVPVRPSPFDNMPERSELADYRAVWHKYHKEHIHSEATRIMELPEGKVELTNEFYSNVGRDSGNVSVGLHFEAAARCRELLSSSVLKSSNAYKVNNADLEVHHRYALMHCRDGNIRAVKLTVRRMQYQKQQEYDRAVNLEVIETPVKIKVELGDFYGIDVSGTGTPSHGTGGMPTLISPNSVVSIAEFEARVKPEDRNRADWLRRQRETDPGYIEGQLFAHDRRDHRPLVEEARREAPLPSDSPERRRAQEYMRTITGRYAAYRGGERTFTDALRADGVPLQQTYRPVTAREAVDILRAGGPYTRGLTHDLKENDIAHFYQKHHEDSPGRARLQGADRHLTDRDLDRILDVIDHYDYITFRPKKDVNKSSITYYKAYPDGILHTVERSVITSGDKREHTAPGLRLKTFYARDHKAEDAQPPAQSPARTPDDPSTASLSGWEYRVYHPGDLLEDGAPWNPAELMA